jgi:hypothetical protein
MIRRLTFLLVALLSSSSLLGQRTYNFYSAGDWVSFTNTRYITCIARGFNTIYFGTGGGLLRYDFQSERWLDPVTISDGLPDDRIRRIAVDRMTDEVWVDTPRGGSYFNPTWNEWRDNIQFPADKLQQPGIDVRDLPLLFPSDGYQYLPGGVLVDRDLVQYPITQLLRDDNEVIWMGLWGLGAARGDLRRDDLEVMTFGPYDADVAYLDKDGENLWFLGGSNGLPGTITHYDRSRETWVYLEPRRESGVISDRFSAIAHDDRNIWLGTDLGLVRIEKSGGRFRTYSHFQGIYGTQVTALLPIKGNLLIGTEQGVSVYDLVRDSIYAANSSNIRGQPIHSFAIRDRTIYAGTDYGIYSLEWGTNKWTKLTFPGADIAGAVYDMQVADSMLYTAGDDGVGVINLNDGSEALYDRNVKFGNSILSTLLVHQGVIWVGGSGGLFRLNKRTGNWYRYTTSDGLISQNVSSLVGDGDYIWIGTDRGVSRFLWKVYNRSDWLE